MNKYRHNNIFWALFQTVVLLALLCWLFASCSTTRYVDRVKVQTDSAIVHQRDSLTRIVRDNQSYIKSLLDQIQENVIIFQDTGSTKIIYRPDGSIESIEGKLKSANSRLEKKDEQITWFKNHYDSLSRVKVKDSVIVNTVTVEKVVNKKVTVFPWWLWLIVAVALISGYWIKKYVNGK